MQTSGFTIQEINIDSILLADYNPRTINKKEESGLRASLLEFGLVENIVINKDLTCIGGHQRVTQIRILATEPKLIKIGNKEYVNKFKDLKTIPCMVVDLNKEDEKKLNISLNNPSIQGHFDTRLQGLLEELKDTENFSELNMEDLAALENLEIEVIPEDDEIVPGQTAEEQQTTESANTNTIENKEVDTNNLGTQGTIMFKFDYQKYLNLVAMLQTAQERLDLDSKEAVLEYLLEDYV